MKSDKRGMSRLVAVVTALLVASGLMTVAVPAANAARCPTVDRVTGAVRPAPTPGVDWSGCNLRGADLRGAHLSSANLHRAYLVGANLKTSYLGGVDLTYATLRRADLTAVGGLTSVTWNRADRCERLDPPCYAVRQ